MKTYAVEMQRVSYVTVHVEAENADDAEAKAWKEVDSRADEDCATWGLESIEEVFIPTKEK